MFYLFSNLNYYMQKDEKKNHQQISQTVARSTYLITNHISARRIGRMDLRMISTVWESRTGSLVRGWCIFSSGFLHEGTCNNDFILDRLNTFVQRPFTPYILRLEVSSTTATDIHRSDATFEVTFLADRH